MQNGKREFICGIYDTSGSAERNLFTSKNSVIKLCSGIMYLGEKLYIGVIKRLYHKIHAIVLKLLPSTCCSGAPTCSVWIFSPWPECSTPLFYDRTAYIWGAGKSWRSLGCVWGQSNDYFLWLVWSRGIHTETGSKQGLPKLYQE